MSRRPWTTSRDEGLTDMRIYLPVPAADADYEWALPVLDEPSPNPLRIHTTELLAPTWSPPLVTLLHEDEGVQLRPADFPWVGGNAIVMRPQAVAVVAPLVQGHAELLPLACEEADLVLLHVTDERDALDEDASDIVRFPTGRILTVRRYGMRSAALEGARCFKLPQMATGPVFLSGDVVDAIEAAGLVGLGAQLVWQDDGPEGR